MYKSFFFLLLFFFGTFAVTRPFRGYSTVWRNDKDEVVKKVVYLNEHTRLSPRFKNEMTLLNELPYGWEYEAIALRNANKLMYRKKKKL